MSVVGSSIWVMARDAFLADGTGATGAGGSARAVELGLRIRAESVLIAAAEARRLRLLASFADEIEQEAGLLLCGEGRRPAAPDELIRTALVGEVQAVLGVAAGPATRLVDLAGRLRDTLPETLDAVETGRLDLTRARVLSEGTAVLSAEAARQVRDRLLGAAGDPPGPGLPRGPGGRGGAGGDPRRRRGSPGPPRARVPAHQRDQPRATLPTPPRD